MSSVFVNGFKERQLFPMVEFSFESKRYLVDETIPEENIVICTDMGTGDTCVVFYCGLDALTGLARLRANDVTIEFTP